jgi:hypothetical protein
MCNSNSKQLNRNFGGVMKKLLLALLLTTNVLAMSEAKTDAYMDSICLHRGTVQNMLNIDQSLQPKEIVEEKIEAATTERD